MSEVAIAIDGSKRVFSPRDAVSGRVSWSLAEVPQSVELRLGWSTEGKGTKDCEIVQTLSFQPLRTNESRDFKLVLPEGPYSFSGKLISLKWALEAEVAPSGETAGEDIVLSPFAEEVLLVSS